MTDNVDPRELAKFGELAHRWWDPNSEFKPLHDINPLRLGWIDKCCTLRGKRVIDVGCGGGLLAEGMATLGADVVGIDLGDKALTVPRLHLLEPGQFDLVTCLEMLEHVPDPASIVRACTALAKPGGQVFFSTINRNPKAYLFAVVGAEYVLKLLPKGTHDYGRFLRPAELARLSRDAGLAVEEIIGMSYNPLSRTYTLGRDTSVNYLIGARRDA